ncbi:SDR family oxidoreductase [Kosmotoga pacifica]|uniref:Oxidoreductase n=1 Tax=Kosmotoga pacifica TaxID=1330330 RepID=A0A0G2ZFK5_9BACT|nr:SDR family oxidoreductase [Kosmotoga pacifica]AKI97548.1 hypothetical protein IX53_06655 [Kosmotoga pacifica]
MDFNGKVVLVTGGAKGIGKAIVLEFLKHSAWVAFFDTDEANSRKLLKGADSGENLLYVRVNVADEEEVEKGVEEVVNNFGTLDILINNAGIGWTRDIYTRGMEEWDRILAVNLRSSYMLSKYCAPYLSKGRRKTPEEMNLLESTGYNVPKQGVIINIASTRALMSEPDSEPYSAAKGGLIALTHSLAISLGPWVRVNAISPGWINVSGENLRAIDHLQHPVGRVGRPEDIAKVCLFLASEEASFITGANFVVDGGMTIKMIYAE